MATTKRITIVNDHPEFLALLAEFLGEEGYDVITLPKHQGAFEQVKQTAPDIVILDMMFDGMPAGWALLDMMHLDPATRTINTIVCSAATRYMQEVAPALAAKGIPWLEKPFALEALLELIEGLDNHPTIKINRKE